MNMLMCRHKPDHIREISEAFINIDLSKEQKLILQSRFLSVLREYSNRSCRYSWSYNGLRVMITVGSLIVPAVLSAQHSVEDQYNSTYWCVWILSLFVTISNGVLALFKIDKKYYIMNSTFQHLLSEGWQYIQLCGRYNGRFTPGQLLTHQSQLKQFSYQIERVRMKQVEDEYYRVPDEKDGHHHPKQDSLLPPTPASPSMSNLTNGILVTESTKQLFETPTFHSNRKPEDTVNGEASTTIRPIYKKKSEHLESVEDTITIESNTNEVE